MEQVHGVDVSWMSQASAKDKASKRPPSPPKTAQDNIVNATTIKPPTANGQKPADQGSEQINGHTNGVNGTNGANGTNGSAKDKRRARSGSVDKLALPGTPQRRNSWFSTISARFSGSKDGQVNPPESSPVGSPGNVAEPIDEEELVPPSPTNHQRSGPFRNAVLQPAARSDGNGPYTPAPPKSGQSGLLGVFRRLSSSSGGNFGPGGKMGHGLVARKVLNVDQNRDRCPISELNAAKLRRVAFCVDVEIAPMPKYVEADAPASAPAPAPVPTSADTAQKKKLSEKGEGEALKNPKATEEKKDSDGTLPTPIDDPAKTEATTQDVASSPVAEPIPDTDSAPAKDKETATKKKEKKKKSEEERKARKEKKRKLAEANGIVPLEIRYDSSDSSSENTIGAGIAKANTMPTINPVRIYRRCCQLRETPILKKITEQLLDSANSSPTTGLVNKLDLTDYWLQMGDLSTLGDYLAVVPVRELILENCNLGDEGLRLILAGLLAAKRPDLGRRRPKHEVVEQGGVVERLVLKNNRLGPNGWKHLSLFLYHCRSLKSIDISHISFPAPPPKEHSTNGNGHTATLGIAEVFSKAISERLGGNTLDLINLGETEPTMEQFGIIIDGIIKCGIPRLGLARNQLDEQGVGHLIRYLDTGNCVGLDVGGNDLHEHIEKLAASIKKSDVLWAISLAGCNLEPSSLCKFLPALVKLPNFRFIDLSHNHGLFTTNPSAVGVLRRYLPKLQPLKRIHLQDVGMTADQAIALAEVLPELECLAHINLLENEELTALADAKTEEAQEEACALFASLMAAARVSKSIICIDIEVPSDAAGDIVKAMAKQVVAYCLRNMEHIPDAHIGAAVAAALNDNQEPRNGESKPPAYPDVLAHLVGHDVLDKYDSDNENDTAPDEDYVIGGTGVVKALKCCLENRGDESRRQSGEFVRSIEDGVVTPTARIPTGGKAKDMSKHLLAGARKIRHRLQPALDRARANPSDEQNLRKLIFLDDTLQGIIKRFEDEFPDTRETEDDAPPRGVKERLDELSSSPPNESVAVGSDVEDETAIHPPRPLSRSNSVLSKVLAEEEGRILRAGHRLRSGFIKSEHYDILKAIDDIGSDPKHVPLLVGMAEDMGGELLEVVKKKGAVRAFKEDRELVYKSMQEADPEHWLKFVESQEKARANISVNDAKPAGQQVDDESAIAD